jgi:hypothetical protein
LYQNSIGARTERGDARIRNAFLVASPPRDSERIDAEADALIGELGVEAYAEALRREYESSVDAIALWWSPVALAIAHKTGERIGLDIASPLAMNTFSRLIANTPRTASLNLSGRPMTLKGALVLKPFRFSLSALRRIADRQL